MINSVQNFVDYFSSVRKRTLNFARLIPEDKLDWSPKAGEFTCADIVRHLAAGEKMFIGVVTQGKWKYDGHEGKQATLAELLAELDQAHAEAMDALKSLPDAELNQPRPAFEGKLPIKAWRWLMVMVEHEIHHRSQLASYLMLMGITPPHLTGIGVEDLIARATG